jgi:hypothetical protein
VIKRSLEIKWSRREVVKNVVVVMCVGQEIKEVVYGDHGMIENVMKS